MKLNELHDNEGARKVRTRVGRGIGSGKGKTCGAGHKGQKARSGVAIKGFEGGQMPLHMRLPKRGFKSRNRKHYETINTGRLQAAIDAGKIDASDITIENLVATGLVGKVIDGVRLLAKGDLSSKISITVTGASKSAIEAVEKLGGTVTTAE